MPAAPEAASSSALAAGGGAQRSGEQRDPGGVLGAAELAGVRQRAEHRLERAGVLGGQHLGRGEQRRLSAGVDGLQHRPQGDDGLAGTDLALQQPVHRSVGGQFDGQHLADLPLALGELERQSGVEVVEQTVVGRGPRRRRLRERGAAPLSQRELHRERLVPGQPVLGPLPLGPVVRFMDGAQRLIE